MESLIRLLLLIGQRITFLSEEERESALDLLREFEADQGLEGIVPPVKGATNRPPESQTETPEPPDPETPEPEPEPEPEPPDPEREPKIDPGPLAEPVPPGEQLPPPVSPEVAGATGNAFTEPAPGAGT